MATRKEQLVAADERCQVHFREFTDTVMSSHATEPEQELIFHACRVYLSSLREMLRVTFTGV